MHKAFPLLVRKFPLLEGTSHYLKKNATARRKKMPLPEDCTASKDKKKLKIWINNILLLPKYLCWIQENSSNGNFEYALWEVNEFVDSYVVPANDSSTTTTNTMSGEKSGRMVTLTIEDMQRKKNDVKARTTLLLSLPNEHHQRFSKHKTARELWAAILKTFGGNEATKKTKKNLLKQQYRNFRAEGLKTLEQTFFRLSDLDTMSLDDLYNHLKVYESKIQKKSKPNTRNMAFISSAKHSRGNDEVNTASVYTTSSNVSTASTNVATVSISQETACAYIASQSSGSQIKFEDINQIDEDDIEEMDIKWNMALLSMRADKFWKKTGKKISIQGSDVSGFDKSKVECFNCHKMGHFAREYRAPRNLDRRRRDTYRQGSKAKEQAPKALMVIDGVGWDSNYMANDEEDHALVAELTFEYYNEGKKECIESLRKELENLKKEKEVVDGKLSGLLTALNDLDNLIESQRSDKSKEGLGYAVVPPPTAQLYLSPKKDLSRTGLSECADDTVTDYSRPSPTVESSSEEDQNRNPSAYENVTSPITSKQFVKFVKASDSQSKSKTDEKETPKKPPVKYAEQYIKPNKKPNIKGNQRNWNNLKSHQLGPDFVMKKKACFNCGDFNHLTYECRKRVKG
nr:hypothetical protein [Tanacetum cinerariifolium]